MPISRFFTCIHSQCPADRFFANVPWQFSARQPQHDRTKQQPNTMGFQNKWRRLVFPAIAMEFCMLALLTATSTQLTPPTAANFGVSRLPAQSSRRPQWQTTWLHWQRRPQHLCFRRPKRQLNLELHNWRRRGMFSHGCRRHSLRWLKRRQPLRPKCHYRRGDLEVCNRRQCYLFSRS